LSRRSGLGRNQASLSGLRGVKQTQGDWRQRGDFKDYPLRIDGSGGWRLGDGVDGGIGVMWFVGGWAGERGL
jgi:hypothetical protein